MELRKYQELAVDRMAWAMRLKGNNLVVLPQGCLSFNTPIKMVDGSYKEVGVIKEGDKVLSYDNVTQEVVENEVDSVFRTSLKQKPMIELSYDKETITVTYDHPFFNGEGFYPLYQLAWGKMEASQRTRLKLLCEQYGADFNHTLSRGLQSCCNETCPRCERLSQNSDGWKNNQGTQSSGGELAGESVQSPDHQSYQRHQVRQQGEQLGVVYGQVQRVESNQGWAYQETRKLSDKNGGGLGDQRQDQGILSRKYSGVGETGKNATIQPATKTIPNRQTQKFTEMGDWRIRIKQAEPYYSICLRKAPYTYFIGREHNFVTHNSGKSVIIAHFAKKVRRNVLILQPNREILLQNAEKLRQYVDDSQIGLYSASVGSKTVSKYTFATIGSIYKNKDDFAHFRVVIIDECSALNPKDIDTMYMKFLSHLPYARVFGLTATPYRMDKNYEKTSFGGYADTVHVTKMINRMKGKFWYRMLHVTQVDELLEQEFLSPLVYHNKPIVNFEQIPLNKSHSDFNIDEYEKIIAPKMRGIINTIQDVVSTHNSTVVFCSSVKQAEELAKVFLKGRAVSATTPTKDRKKIIEQFKSGELRLVFNVNILSYGFDHPSLDSIVLLRPTKSMAWHLQTLGRGMRIAEGKTHCDIYDFAGNVGFLGTAESLKIVKLEDGWNIETNKGFWHNKELYRYKPTTRRMWG